MQFRSIFSLSEVVEKSREEYRKGQYITLENLKRRKRRKIILNSILKLIGKYKGKKPARPINLTRVRDYINYSKW